MPSTYFQILLSSMMDKLGSPKSQADIEEDLKNPNSVERIVLSLQITIIQITQQIREKAIEAYRIFQEELTGRKLEKSTNDDVDDYQSQRGLELPEMNQLKEIQAQLDKMKQDLDDSLLKIRTNGHQAVMSKLYENKEFNSLLSDLKLNRTESDTLLSKISEMLSARGSFTAQEKGQIYGIVGTPEVARSETAEAAKWDAGTQIKIIGKLLDTMDELNLPRPSPSQRIAFANRVFEPYENNKELMDQIQKGNTQALDRVLLDITPASVENLRNTGTFTPPSMQQKLAEVLPSGGEKVAWSMQTQMMLTAKLREMLIDLQNKGQIPAETQVNAVATSITNMIGKHYKDHVTDFSSMTPETVLKLKELSDSTKPIQKLVELYRVPEDAIRASAKAQKANAEIPPAPAPPAPPPLPGVTPTRGF